MLRITDWLWEHVVFHLVTYKDTDYKITGGGVVRNNRVCKFVWSHWP